MKSSADKLFSPSLRSQFNAACKPKIPGKFGVPASKRSGINSGTVSTLLRLPVPPEIKGSIFRTSSSRRIKPPIPCGPKSPLCPVKQRISICIFSISIGKTPAVCAESRMKTNPFSLQKFPTSSIGSMVPKTLLAWVITTAFVSGRRQLESFSGFKLPSDSHCTLVKLTPFFSSCLIGRITALCSMEETITWSPLCKSPFNTTFRLSVIFLVNTTFL